MMSEGPPENGGWDDDTGDNGEDVEVPEEVEHFHDSYLANLTPFAMDTSLDDSQFGYFQDLYYQGFVTQHDQGARAAFISALYEYYDLDFDWDAWREEYESV